MLASEAIEMIQRYIEINGNNPIAIRSNLLGDVALCIETKDNRWVPIFE